MKPRVNKGHTGCSKYTRITARHRGTALCLDHVMRFITNMKAKVKLSEEIHSSVCESVLVWPYLWALRWVCRNSWRMGGQAERWQWRPGSVLEQCCPLLAPHWTHSAHCGSGFLYRIQNTNCYYLCLLMLRLLLVLLLKTMKTNLMIILLSL